MKLTQIQALEAAGIWGHRYDAIFCASGFETRATFLATLLAKHYGDKEALLFALGFSDRKEAARAINDRVFKHHGFKAVPSDGGDYDAITQVLSQDINFRKRSSLSLLVDISSMPRTWYAGLIAYLRNSTADGPRDLQVVFSYSPGEYSPPPQNPAPLTAVDFIPGFGGIQDPDMPSALVVGLGYELGRASAVHDLQDPALTYAWIADPSEDRRYLDDVLKNNARLLGRLPASHVVRYGLRSMAQTVIRLESLCTGLSQSHRVAIAPLGPKPFSLAALLVAAIVERLDVWRATTGESGDVVDRRPSGPPAAVQVRFSQAD